MKTIYLLKGLPASGKTTWALDMVRKSKGSIVRVNKDDLRAMLHAGIHSKAREDQTLELRDFVITNSLGRGKHVIVDDTNLHPKHEETIRNLAHIYSAKVEVKTFDIDLEECIERDAKRAKPVGEKVILDMYNRYLREKDMYKPDTNQQDFRLPPAIICDLDGTLALLNGRDPYDASRCGNDIPNDPIKYVLNLVKGVRDASIILVSGRKDTYQPQTEHWLKMNDVHYDHLFMRKGDDNRKDSIVKQEIYDNEIKGKYYVRFVLDDRDQVVTMWRANGLTCLQVAEGNF